MQLSLFDAGDYYQFPTDLLDYNEHFLPEERATGIEKILIETVSWKQSTQKLFDKEILTPRLTAWYGDDEKSYHLGGNEFSHQFNSVLLNFYRDGNDSVAWHRDKESELGNRPVIASVSFGQVRNFDFRKKDNHQNKYSLPLHHGSLLIMKGDLQTNWEHRIAKSARPMKPRINLTFRNIREL